MSKKNSNGKSAKTTGHGGNPAATRLDTSKAQAAADRDDVQTSITREALVQPDTNIVFDFRPDCVEAKPPPC